MDGVEEGGGKGEVRSIWVMRCLLGSEEIDRESWG